MNLSNKKNQKEEKMEKVFRSELLELCNTRIRSQVLTFSTVMLTCLIITWSTTLTGLRENSKGQYFEKKVQKLKDTIMINVDITQCFSPSFLSRIADRHCRTRSRKVKPHRTIWAVVAHSYPQTLSYKRYIAIGRTLHILRLDKKTRLKGNSAKNAYWDFLEDLD